MLKTMKMSDRASPLKGSLVTVTLEVEIFGQAYVYQKTLTLTELQNLKLDPKKALDDVVSELRDNMFEVLEQNNALEQLR